MPTPTREQIELSESIRQRCRYYTYDIRPGWEEISIDAQALVDHLAAVTAERDEIAEAAVARQVRQGGVMPTIKEKDNKNWQPKYCGHPSHEFPNMWCPRPGTYIHVCPSCGQKQTMVVAPKVTL